MDDIFIYCVVLPSGVHEMVTPCADGYTVYLNALDCKDRQEQALNHVIRHIKNGDFEKVNVQTIEAETHGKE